MAQMPLVLQLQQLATDNSTDITELLRKSLLVATKLGLQSFRNWVNQELHGYGVSDVPAYRHVRAELKADNPNQGLIPFLIDDKEMMEAVCDAPLQEPIGSLADLMEIRYEDKGHLRVPMTPKQKLILMHMQDNFVQLEPVRTIGRNQVAAILDAVRTKILEWSLQLEADGVIGEGMTFSPEEKQRAQSSVTIENFRGILGDVSGSVVTQNLQMSVRAGDFADLHAYLSQQGVSSEDIKDLERAIAADPEPVSSAPFGEYVSAWIGRMVSKASAGAWQVGVGTAGGLLGKALGAYYGF